MEIDQFVERQNIAHYAERLKTEPDLNKRTTLEQLLAEETAKRASHDNVGKQRGHLKAMAQIIWISGRDGSCWLYDAEGHVRKVEQYGEKRPE
jgi:hypothetical protein